MVERQFVPHPDGAPTGGRAYSKAVVTRGGRTAWLAGVTNQDAEGRAVNTSVEDATRAVFDRLADSARLAGATLEDIVTMTVFITDARYGDEFVRIRGELFAPDRYPASALITCAGLARPDLTIEIQAIAVVDD